MTAITNATDRLTGIIIALQADRILHIGKGRNAISRHEALAIEHLGHGHIDGACLIAGPRP